MDGVHGHMELILLAVIDRQPTHGWAIIDQARRLSDGVFELGEGGIYPVLHKLEREGLVQSSWTDVAGRSRRVYRVTRKGRAELSRRSADWGRVAHGMRALLGWETT